MLSVEFQVAVGHVEMSPSLDSSDWSRDIEKQKQSKKWRFMNTLKNILKDYRHL